MNSYEIDEFVEENDNERNAFEGAFGLKNGGILCSIVTV